MSFFSNRKGWKLSVKVVDKIVLKNVSFFNIKLVLRKVVDEIVKKTTNREIRMLKTLKHENIVILKEAFKR